MILTNVDKIEKLWIKIKEKSKEIIKNERNLDLST